MMRRCMGLIRICLKRPYRIRPLYSITPTDAHLSRKGQPAAAQVAVAAACNAVQAAWGGALGDGAAGRGGLGAWAGEQCVCLCECLDWTAFFMGA